MKCILLSRISTAQQSLDAQTNDLINEALRLGYKKEDMIVLEDVESGIKLTEHERHGLNQLKRYITEDPSINTVICWEPSRLARQQKILYSIRDFLVAKKVQLIILKPYVQLLDPDGKMNTTASIVFSLFSTLAENEMLIKKERMARAKNMMIAQGKLASGKVLFGYMKDSNKMPVPHPVDSKTVQYIFNTYLNENISMYYLYKRLMLQGVFPNLKRNAATSRIQSIIRNNKYSSGEGIYPPIITKEIQEACQRKGKENTYKSKTSTKYTFILKDLVYCGICGSRMRTFSSTYSYKCDDKRYVEVNPHTLYISTKVLENLVWEDVLSIANLNSNFHQTKTIQEYTNKIEANKKSIENLHKIINDLNEKEERLVSLYIKGKINENIYNNQYNAIKIEKQSYHNEIVELENQIVEYESLINENNNYIERKPITFYNITDNESKKEIIKQFINKVIVNRIGHNRSRIDLEYKPNVITVDNGMYYTYCSNGGWTKVWRHNGDGTVDEL